MTEETTWLTPTAHKNLSEEYEYMTTTGRREISEKIAEARSHGDLKENADYDAAKNEQGLQEAKIRKLRQILENAVIRDAIDDGTVQVGSVATLRDEDGDEDEYFVAVPENRVPGYLLASPLGPMGAALVGSTIGEEVSYDAPGGTFTVTVVAIRPFEG
jgi:transcription elongation factor GreA